MNSFRLCMAASLLVAVVSGCACPTSVTIPGVDAGTEDAGGGGGGGTDGGDGGTTDAGTPIIVNPDDPQNPVKDSDCDGLTDAEEFGTVYAGNKRTDPAVADTDGDGILDGVEAGRTSSVDAACTGFAADADPLTLTLPTEADSDADGLSDGIEDANKNGALDSGETNPNSPDSDGDGLADGTEDANANGVVDPGETDPRLKDTDGDKINDGVERSSTMTDPTQADTDGDSCLDGDEDLNQNGTVDPGESNPLLGNDCGSANTQDTDSDGILDAVEDLNGNGQFDPATERTSLLLADTDGDGLGDGVEDKNKNGLLDVGETDPTRVDTDCDGLIDGPDNGAVKGEDQNANGVKDATETDPLVADTDGDGLKDGLERGVTVNPDGASCPGFVPDSNAATTTDATNSDSDGDGIADGAEDANQNGAVDSGELDPGNNADGGGVAGKACSAANLRPVVFRAEGGPDLRLGLPATFNELVPMIVGGQTKGLIGFDSTRNVAFIAWRQAAPGAATNPTADEAAIRPTISGLGALSNVTTQTFTSWDSLPALQAFYQQAGVADVKLRANDLANALVGAGAGALSGLAGVTGPFQLQAEYVHRTNSAVVVVLALTPQANFVEPAIFTVGDTAGGSALAQFGDGNAVQCETFQPGNSLVDFLFVVDDSCSMASSQNALAASANAVEQSLNNSSLDWRLSMVTTSYTTGGEPNTNVLRGFTRNMAEFKDWLTQGSATWVGTGGTGTEKMLHAGRQAVTNLTPASATEIPGKIRDGAILVVVGLGDADDQSSDNVNDYIAFFNNTGTTAGVTKNGANQKITFHGIVCPAGSVCNSENQANTRHGAVITATGGVRGDISVVANIGNAISAIINSAIAAAGHKMSKPPIGASVKVAMDSVLGACNQDDIPRSRIDGFDFDGVNRTISFFGACRPGTSPVNAAVSYRYWIDSTPNPGGNPPPCSTDSAYDPNDPDFCQGNLACNLGTNVCECPSNCGGTAPAGKVCNPNKLVCDFVCTADCGGSCGGYQACDTNSCACACVQNASCAAGFKFQNTGGVCGCVCDEAALACPSTHQSNAASCSCVCKPDCGGCAAGTTCNPSTCSCESGIG